MGLVKILDLGEWWDELTGGLPLPLGANAVRRDVGDEATLTRLSHLLRNSIAYSPLDHRQPALAHAEKFGRGLDMDLADTFVRDVRERAHPGLRRRRTCGGRRAPAPWPRGRARAGPRPR